MAEIRTVAVIGAGAGGRAIARAWALAGYRTILEDILPAKLRKAEAELRERSGTPEKQQGASPHMEYASTVEEAARQADLVIEAVPDELESKIEIFTLLDKICKPQTVLASSTLTLSITEIASVTYRRQKCIGIRFIDSAEKLEKLELVPGQETDDETIAACVGVGRRMGRTIVISDNRTGMQTSSEIGQ